MKRDITWIVPALQLGIPGVTWLYFISYLDYGIFGYPALVISAYASAAISVVYIFSYLLRRNFSLFRTTVFALSVVVVFAVVLLH